MVDEASLEMIREQSSGKLHQVVQCQSCQWPMARVPLQKNQKAHCPRCDKVVYQAKQVSLSGNLALAVTCILLLVPAHFYNFIEINLFGVSFSGSLFSGVMALAHEGYIFLALLVMFCSSIAPFTLFTVVILAHVALKYRLLHVLDRCLKLMRQIRHWVMIDVFLVSIAISCFKLQDYADISLDTGLFSLILLQILAVLLLSRINIEQYWNAWQCVSTTPVDCDSFCPERYIQCGSCYLTQDSTHTRCIRCTNKMSPFKPHSLQRSWAYLITATAALLPANLIPISILMTNGKQIKDTIFSGVLSLVQHDLLFIAVIIFIASILVPIIKIVGIGYVLISISYGKALYQKQCMKIYAILKWIGKWSMVDLFVISIMLTLVDRGQVLNFTPGLGAVAFGVVIVCTMLSAESLDARLIWKLNRRIHQQTDFLHE
ncbi:PqiA/YebS family transporter subunit [Vibrio sinus]|uniref:PqiA/YebS family transporter subunit n=1 Tax=Vibrio sinus TaxID=2946865 RepID=UPI003D6DCD27